MKRIAFTGGSGKAGRHVISYLLSCGYEILNLDLGVLLWLSFQIILSGHAITTNNNNNMRRVEEQLGNLDYKACVYVISVFVIVLPKINSSSSSY